MLQIPVPAIAGTLTAVLRFYTIPVDKYISNLITLLRTEDNHSKCFMYRLDHILIWKAVKICIITNRLDLQVKKKSTLLYVIKPNQRSISTFHGYLPIISEINLKRLLFLPYFSKYSPFYLIQV